MISDPVAGSLDLLGLVQGKESVKAPCIPLGEFFRKTSRRSVFKKLKADLECVKALC